MRNLHRLLCTTTISPYLIALILLPTANSHGNATISSHTSNKQNSRELSSQLLFEITLHGFLLWASLGFVVPVSVLIIRMSNREQCGRRLKILFYIHILSLVLVTAGAVLSIRSFENSFINYHQRIGLVLYGLVWLQALTGLFRPHRGTNKRSIWLFLHWVLGTAVPLLGIINIYTGLQAYHKKTSRSIRLWNIIFTAEVSFIAFLYLLQDKWEYIQKQGVILGNESIRPTDQDKSLMDNEKEPLA
ncbi:Cytochrome b561/ferric reductase transmembrane [Dillenia turbinata]|uniref:Cytochrome b561/ferric reductase transmembrane n=1 Tax=Dillenia turbinata TaxID=194707 RepID=A0AAN8UJL5_9MAGN